MTSEDHESTKRRNPEKRRWLTLTVFRVFENTTAPSPENSMGSPAMIVQSSRVGPSTRKPNRQKIVELYQGLNVTFSEMREFILRIVA